MEETFALAFQHHKNNNLQTAENLYKEILKKNPNHFESTYYLSKLFAQTKRFNLAKSLLGRAIQLRPDYAKAHNNLGIILTKLKENQKALNSFKKAIQIQPNYSDAHYNVGIVMQELGEHKEAIIYYEKAIQIKPDYAKAYNNLGIALQELGEYRKAINEYKKAILIVPNSIIVNGLSDLFKSIKLGNIKKDNSDDLKDLLLFLYKKNNINHDNIFHNSKLLLFLGENENQLKQNIHKNSSLLQNKIIQNLLNDKLFLLMLQKSLIADKFFEKLLTKLRNEILLSLMVSNKDVLKKYFDFIVSLAEQCFLNEYVYSQSKNEINFINQLKNRIINNNEINKLEVAVLACYIPLNTSKKIINKLIDYKSDNILFNDLITINIKEPLEEIKLASSIKSFKKIDDTISKKVREQYEEHPYPRWRYVNKYSHANFLFQLNDEIKPNQVKYNKKFLNPKVLIAGCGTGQHIASAERYLNSNILGVDISLKSLAYAKRKVLELNLKNIEFLHADILQLKNLEKKFDIIECVGTLHHMKDPLSGLKILLDLLEPHGFLKLGLYSKIARQNILKARELIKKRKIKNTTENIRIFRESIINEKEDQSLQKILNIKDFYSTSMVRDLIFHVQEHVFTLPKISKILKDLNSEFLGFINPSIKFEYSKLFYKDTKNISLDNWNKFEMTNQEAFSNMYQFWIRKIRKF